jgi:hypothetical protein
VNGVHPFIASCDDVAKRNDEIYTVNLGNVISAAVPGHGFSTLDFTVDGSTVTYWRADGGEIPFLESVAYA